MADTYKWEHGKFIVDLHNKHYDDEMTREECLEHAIEWCGLIPEFIQAAVYAETLGAEQFMDKMCEEYGFGRHEMGGELSDSGGIYRYPDDPDMYPIVMFMIPDCKVDVYVYNYGIVAVEDMENTIIVRMD